MTSAGDELSPEVDAVVSACMEVLRQTPSAVVTDIDGTVSPNAPTPAEAERRLLARISHAYQDDLNDAVDWAVAQDPTRRPPRQCDVLRRRRRLRGRSEPPRVAARRARASPRRRRSHRGSRTRSRPSCCTGCAARRRVCAGRTGQAVHGRRPARADGHQGRGDEGEGVGQAADLPDGPDGRVDVGDGTDRA